jgi:hypothetical protein
MTPIAEQRNKRTRSKGMPAVFLAEERFTAHVGLVRLAMAGLGEVRIEVDQQTAQQGFKKHALGLLWLHA